MGPIQTWGIFLSLLSLAIGNAPTAIAESAEGATPLWFVLRLNVAVPATYSFQVQWKIAANGSGYDAFQAYIQRDGISIGSEFWISRFSCPADAAATTNISGIHGTVRARGPLCSFNGESTQDWSLVFRQSGHYVITIARAGDLARSGALTAISSPTVEVMGLSSGGTVYFATVAQFADDGSAITASSALHAIVSVNSELKLRIENSLNGFFVFWSDGISTGSIEVSGPQNFTGAREYDFDHEPAGSWTFHAHLDAALGPSEFLLVFVVDAPS